MYKLLLTAAGEGPDAAIIDVCRTAGVSRSTFYRWIRKSAVFRSAWQELPRRIFETQLPRLSKICAAKAAAGNGRMMRLAFEFGLAKPASASTLNVGGQVDVNHGGKVEHQVVEQPDRQRGILEILNRAGAIGDRAVSAESNGSEM